MAAPRNQYNNLAQVLTQAFIISLKEYIIVISLNRLAPLEIPFEDYSV